MIKRVGANQRLRKKDHKKQAPKKIKGIVSRFIKTGTWFSLIIIICLASIWGSKKLMVRMQNIDFLTIQNITVVGIEHIDTASVLKGAAIKEGTSLFTVKTAQLKKKLYENDWIEKVRIKRKIPETLVISILEREPVALVNKGNVYLVDHSGFLWPLKLRTFWNLPIVSGLKDTVDAHGKTMLVHRDMVMLNKFLSEVNVPEKSNYLTISQLNFSSNNQVQVKFESSPLTVMFNCDNAGKRVKHLWDILKTVEKNSAHMPEYINLCYNNIAFVKQ